MTLNRVEDYYLTAKAFLELPEMAQYVIGTSFCSINYEEFRLNPEGIPLMIFERVIQKNKYLEFRSIVTGYKFGKNK
jgi:hypothetical protein